MNKETKRKYKIPKNQYIAQLEQKNRELEQEINRKEQLITNIIALINATRVNGIRYGGITTERESWGKCEIDEIEDENKREKEKPS